MANYQVGNLDLTLQAVSNDTIASLDNVINRLGKVSTLIKTTTKGTASGKIANAVSGKGGLSGITKSLNFGVALAKLRMTVYFTRRLVNGLAKVVQYGNDYTETLNMWQVAIRNNLDSADKFIKKMNTAYGISTKVLMENQAIFKNMLSSMGQMSEYASYQISETLTQMVLDYASLWNTTIENASEKFKAMLAGQIRPIRSISGIDVSEKTIYDIYQGMGGTKTMRQLTQVEKRLLRIYATYSQMESAGATGDFAKTIEQFANQSRMMVENFKELATWIGIGLKYLLEEWEILQKINAGLIVAREVVKALVYSMGYEDENFLDGMFESVENVNDAVDELQGKLLSFDKFESLKTNDSGSIISIDAKVLELLAKYNSFIGQSSNKANKLAEKWLSILGFTKDTNGEFEITADKLEDIKNKILEVAVAIGIVIGILTVADIVKFVVTLGRVGNAIGFIAVGIGLVYSGIKQLINGDIRTGLFDIALAIGAISLAIGLLIGGWIPFLVAGIAAATALIIYYWDEVWFGLRKGISGILYAFYALGKTISGIFFTLVEGIIELINGAILAYDKVSRFFGGKGTDFRITLEYDYGYMSYSELDKDLWGDYELPTEPQRPDIGIGSVFSNVQEATSNSTTEIKGDVYLNQQKVGKIIADPVYKEGVRVGYFEK